MSLSKKETIQIKELTGKKARLIKKIKGALSPTEKHKISDEIKDINNLIVEKIQPLKYKLNKKMEEEEERIKQSKVIHFREFPYCFFSAKTIQNLLNDQYPLSPSDNRE